MIQRDVSSSRVRFSQTSEQWLLFKNTDPMLHLAHALFASRELDFNIALAPGKVRRKPVVSLG